MAWTKITSLDTNWWHKVESGLWFGRIPPNFYPITHHPIGELRVPSVTLSNPQKWALSAGGIFNAAHNYSFMTLGLLAACGAGAIAAQVCGPRRTASLGQWGLAFGNVGLGQPPGRFEI